MLYARVQSGVPDYYGLLRASPQYTRISTEHQSSVYTYSTDHRCPGLNKVANGKWYIPDGYSPGDITYCSWCVERGGFKAGDRSTISVNQIGLCNCDCYQIDSSSLIKEEDMTITAWKPNLRSRYNLVKPDEHIRSSSRHVKRLAKIKHTHDIEIKNGSCYYILIQCPGYFRVKIENTNFDIDKDFPTYFKDYVLIPRAFEYHQNITKLTQEQWELIKTHTQTKSKLRFIITRFNRIKSPNPLKMSNRYLGSYMFSKSNDGLILNTNDDLVKSSFNCVVSPTLERTIAIQYIDYSLDRFVQNSKPLSTVIRFNDSISSDDQIMRTHNTTLFTINECS